LAAADLAILGAAVRTLDPARPAAEAFAVAGARIVAVGDAEDVRPHLGAATERVDGRGLTVVPGLVDSHIHPFHGTDGTRGADLGGLRTLEEVRAALAAERRRCDPGEWVLGHGLAYDAFGEEPIAAAAVEDVLDGAPAYVTFFDYHSALATRPALARAGVTGPRAFAEGAEIVCDAAGRPTGMLREGAAMALVRDLVPPRTWAQRLDAYAATLRRLNATGLTGAHVMLSFPDLFEVVEALEARGELTVRCVLPLWQRPEVTDEEVGAQLALRDRRGRRWRAGVAKFFIDGVIDTGTAWLHDTPGSRPFWPDPDRYAAVVAAFSRAGFQCATHAIGDRAVTAALDAYRAAGAAPGVTHRIEHLETLRDAELARLVPEGVAASMQPIHLAGLDEPDRPSSWRAGLAPDQVARGFRWADVRRSGAPLALGSDWPVSDHDPRLGLAWAQLRREPGRPERVPFGPEQALDALQALEGYTTHAARVVGEAHLGGRIAPGLRADLTAFAGDPLATPPDELPDLPVALTVVDGEVVFAATAA